jgi:hypothetical protein
MLAIAIRTTNPFLIDLSLYSFDFFLGAKVENIDEIEKCFADYF